MPCLCFVPCDIGNKTWGLYILGGTTGLYPLTLFMPYHLEFPLIILETVIAQFGLELGHLPAITS